jgi:hypothetical protein
VWRSSHFFRQVELPKRYDPPCWKMYSATCFHGILARAKSLPLASLRTASSRRCSYSRRYISQHGVLDPMR